MARRPTSCEWRSSSLKNANFRLMFRYIWKQILKVGCLADLHFLREPKANQRIESHQPSWWIVKALPTRGRKDVTTKRRLGLNDPPAGLVGFLNNCFLFVGWA